MRHTETVLARFSLALLVVYFPVETWVSLPYGLWHPLYLVDFIAMILLFFGARHSLRARPERAPGPLCAAWGWAAANGWRATTWRWLDYLDNEGRNIDRGVVELWVVSAVSLLAAISVG